ncbi:hypothetical protein NUSPORA_00224 [Nucleospora cyclopteri]
MTNFLTKDKILRYYAEKNDFECIEDIKKSLLIASEDPLLNFFYSILFWDVVTVQINELFSFLLRSRKMTSSLLEHHFSIKLERKIHEKLVEKHVFDESKVSKIAFCRLILELEKSVENISKTDDLFMNNLFQSLYNKEYDEILREEPSPMKIRLMNFLINKNKNVVQSDFYKFANLSVLDLKESLKICDTLNFEEIKNTILSSRYSAIKKKIRHFYLFYPELKVGNLCLFEKRLEYFSNPLKLPLRSKILQTYLNINIVEYCEMEICNSLSEIFGTLVNKENVQSFYQMYYINLAISKEKFKLFKKVFNDIFFENKQLFSLFLSKEHSNNVLKHIIKHLPMFMTNVDVVLEITILKRSEYYFNLLGMIIEHYPTAQNAQLIQKYRFYLSKKFLQKYAYLLKSL